MSGFFKAFKARRAAASALYQTALTQARRPAFYMVQGVPDSVTGRFEMTVLHSFLVWNRLRAEGKPGAKLAQGVFDAMFTDMERSLRLIGIGDLSVPRHMKRMMKGFKGRALAYRDGLENPDDPDVLLSAIHRNLFGTVPMPPDEALRWFAGYIKQSAARLARQPWADLQNGLIIFESIDDEQQEISRPLIPEWPHRVDVAKLGNNPLPVKLQATAEQCRDLARRFKVTAIHAAAANLTVQRQVGSHHIHVTGQMMAEVEQACIVTAEPVRSQIAEDIDAWFSDEEQVVSFARARRAQESLRADVELEILPESEDPEPVLDGTIDVGELAAEYLALAIDPYPRGDAARVEDDADEAVVVAQAASRPNPFAALKDWKAGRDKKK